MHLRTFFYLAFLASGALPFVCIAAESNPSFFPVFVFGEELPPTVKIGFIDQTGTVMMPPSEEIFLFTDPENRSSFVEGLEPFEVKLKTKWPALSWGYLDTKFNISIAPQFSSASSFSEGVAAAGVNKQPWNLGYIDHSGKFVIAPQFEEAHPFSEGLAQVVNSDHLMGYIDHGGKWAIKPQYLVRSEESNFSEGLACVGKKSTVQKSEGSSSFVWGYIDKEGTQVIDFKYEDASAFHSGLAAVNVAQGFGYINKTGAFVIPPRYRLAWSFSEGLARVETKDGKMSYIDQQGNVVFTIPHLNWADPFSDGLANASIRGSNQKLTWGYIDHTGKFVIEPTFQSATPFVNGLAQVLLNGEIGYINKSGHFVWKTKAPDASKFFGGSSQK